MVEKPVRIGFDISTHNYIRAASTLALITENITHTPLPEKTISHWKHMMYAMRIGDDRLDNITDDKQRFRFKKSVMEFLRNEPVLLNDSELNLSMTQLREVCNDLTEQNRHTLLHAFDNLLNVTEKLRQTEKEKDFSCLSRLEGHLAGRLFLTVLPDEYINSPKYGDIVKTITRLGRIGNVVDDFSDLPDDFREKIAKIKPTACTRIKLLLRSVPDAISVFRHMRINQNLTKELIMDTKSTLENNPRKQKNV
jgi:hypothetical protein